jgi:hypothetical protein
MSGFFSSMPSMGPTDAEGARRPEGANMKHDFPPYGKPCEAAQRFFFFFLPD